MNENNTSSSKTAKKIKRKGRFNLIDFLLILLVLLLVASIVYVFVPKNFVSGLFADKKYTIEYSVEFTGVDKKFLGNIQVGNPVLDSVSKANIGTVVAIDDSTQYSELTYNGVEGVMTPVIDKYNIVVTIKASVDYSEGKGYSINGTRIAVGEKINARFPNFVYEGYCISVPIT
jgi:hypothetical protein